MLKNKRQDYLRIKISDVHFSVRTFATGRQKIRQSKQWFMFDDDNAIQPGVPIIDNKAKSTY